MSRIEDLFGSRNEPNSAIIRLIRLEEQLQRFVDWFEASRHQTDLDPLLRAGITHFWFVTLHPFDDGNGRLTRTLTDLALAQGEAQAIRFYAMSVSILDDRAGYYRILENSQKATLDITAWLTWFLQTLLRSLHTAMAQIESVLGRHGSGRPIAPQLSPLNRPKCLTGYSMEVKKGSNRGSVPLNTRPWPRSQRRRQRDTWRSCWKKAAWRGCPVATQYPLQNQLSR